MSDRGDAEKKKAADNLASLLGTLSIVLVVLFGIGGALYETVWPHLHGATPADLEKQALARTPKQLAHDLPSTELHDTSVDVRFRVGAAHPYKEAKFTWKKDFLDAPYEMELRSEHDSKEEEEPDVITPLTQHLHRIDDHSFKWGAVRISAHGSDGDLSFNVDHEIGKKPNPMFDKQIDYARQVILNAAFGTPITASEQELADVLGTGYSAADLGKLDPTTPNPNASAVVAKLFPASALARNDSQTFDIPLNHPLIDSIRLDWESVPSGTMRGVTVRETTLYKDNRAAFMTCLEPKIGPSVTKQAWAWPMFELGNLSLGIDTHHVILTFTQPIDPTSWKRLFDAIAACGTDVVGASVKAHGDRSKSSK